MADKPTPSTPRDPYAAIQAMLGVTHRSSAEAPLRLPSEDGLFSVCAKNAYGMASDSRLSDGPPIDEGVKNF